MRSQRVGRAVTGLLVFALLSAGCASTVQTRTTTELSSDGPGSQGLSSTGTAPAPSAGTSGTAAGTGSTTGAVTPGGGSLPGGGSGGTTTGSTGSSGPSLTAGSTTGTVAATGPGWDKTSVYFGVPTEEDLSKTLAAAGISFSPGSLQADVKAIADDLNAKGGLFGRKLVPVFHDNHASDVSSNPEAAAEANCAALTQDRRVISVLNPIAPIESDSFLQCMKKTRTPLMSIGYSTYADDVYQKFGPYLYTTLTPSVSHFVPSYIPALAQAGYFGGWDTTGGTAKNAPAVVGILEPDTASGHTVAALQVTALRKAGIKVGQQYFYREDSSAYGSDMSAAILSFRNAGVSHVLDITNVAAAVVIFAETAQQQRYFPRYGMTSWLLPDTAASVFAQAGVSQQLSGAVGIGWTPGGDVNSAHDPGQTAPQRACMQALARQGVTYSGDKQRFALNTAWALCDDVNLLVNAAKRGGGLTPDALKAGMEALTTSFQPAVTFSSALSQATHFVPGSHRVLQYDTGCSCFHYEGATHRMS